MKQQHQPRTLWSASSCILISGLLWAGIVVSSLADVVSLTTGERLVGKVVAEETAKVVFESEGLGRIEIPRGRIEKIERSAPLPEESAITAPKMTLSTNVTEKPTSPMSTLFGWLPAPLPDDKHDWIQLKSGEWLRGKLKAMQNRKLEFDSDELNDVSFDWKDVHQVRLPKAFIAYGDKQTAYGELKVDQTTATVSGPEELSIPRGEVEGITPGEPKEINYWSGKISVGLNLRTGNTKQADLVTKATIERRTPKSHLKVDYLGNYSEVEGVETVNNDRATLVGDIFVTRRWFVRALQAEYYHDPFQNIDMRITGGVGAGYYLISRPKTEWLIAGGPGYQYTRFSTVEAGAYGTCEMCGEDISIERLKARPVTTYCIQCKTRKETMERMLGS